MENRKFLNSDTHLIFGIFLDGTQSRIRELHIDQLFVIVELVLCGQVEEWVGREAGSHYCYHTVAASPRQILSDFLSSTFPSKLFFFFSFVFHSLANLFFAFLLLRFLPLVVGQRLDLTFSFSLGDLLLFFSEKRVKKILFRF